MTPSSSAGPSLPDAAAQLPDSEARYRALVESTSDWIWEMDLDGRHTYSNRQVEVILGIGADELARRELGDLLHPEDARRSPIACPD